MAEPTDAVMRILQQIQVSLADHTKRFDKIDVRFDRLERTLNEVNEGMITSLGLAGHAHVRHDSVAERLDELTRRVDVLEQTK